MTAAMSSEQVRMIANSAGVSVREAAKHLILAERFLHALDIRTEWIAETYQLLSDLAHELDPGITPYPSNV
jgi:PP-loop superfamily ATP-utilizing enzyme